MAKGRLNRHQGKRSSTVVLVLSVLLMLTVVLLMLLALGIFNLPVGSDDESSSSINDHIKFKRLNLNVGEGDGLGERGEQWTEILSWEPRAFLFHNFLVLVRVIFDDVIRVELHFVGVFGGYGELMAFGQPFSFSSSISALSGSQLVSNFI